MSKLAAFFDLFRKGNAVANPELWKHGGEALKAAIVGLALSINSIGKAFGHDLQIDETSAAAFAAIAVWASGLFFTYATSDKVGLPPKPETPVPPEADLRNGA